jgi:glycosyltransferase involved in cell wall biosynthesis
MLAVADMFALPSWANEGVPQAIMQAMAMQLPVVSTTVGAIDEAVIDGETGIMIEPKNSPALAAALKQLIDNPDQRQQFGQAGRMRIENNYSAKHMVDAMESVFTKAIADFAGQ